MESETPEEIREHIYPDHCTGRSYCAGEAGTYQHLPHP